MTINDLHLLDIKTGVQKVSLKRDIDKKHVGIKKISNMITFNGLACAGQLIRDNVAVFEDR